MDYLNKYFGKDQSVLSYEDIENFFINSQEESDKIEFKSYTTLGSEKDKLNAIIESICGMLNSSGGLIVWGAPVGKNQLGKTEKIFQGALTPLPKLYEKDAMINKISDLITPTASMITFFTFEKSGNYVYIFSIEESMYKPHQTGNKYYMRLDGQTRIAPHHYIEALFKQVKVPNLKGFIRLKKFSMPNNKYLLDFIYCIFNFSKFQNERNLEYWIHAGIGAKFSEWNSTTHNSEYDLDGQSYHSKNQVDIIYFNQPYIGNEILEIDRNELAGNNDEFTLHLHFASRNSPVILSNYTIRIDFNGRTKVEDFLIKKDENRFLFEHSDSLGETEGQRAERIMGSF